MAPDAPNPPRVRELEALRIKRGAPSERRSRLLPLVAALLILAAIGAGAYELYLRTLGRPTEVQTS
jgi:hypothetical protein